MSDLIFYDRTSLLPIPVISSIPVVRQFMTDWMVASNHHELTSLHLKSNVGTVPLQRIEGDETTFGEPRWALCNDPSIPGWDFAFTSAGWLNLYGMTKDGSELALTPSLKIEPASLSQDEFEKIVARLEHLAEFPHGVCSVTTPNESSIPSPRLGNLMHTVHQVLSFYDALRSSWRSIVKHPWKEVRTSQTILRANSQLVVRSPRLNSRQVPNDRAHALYNVPVETVDTIENRFVGGLIKLLRREIRRTISMALQEMSRLQEAISDTPTARQLYLPARAAEDFSRKIQNYRAHLNAELESLRFALERLRSADRWASRSLSHPLIRGLKTTDQIRGSSLRLMNSSTYGAAHRAFKAFAASKPQRCKTTAIVRRLRERRVGKTWELYEIWVFLEIYITLIDVFGFCPEPGTPAPSDLLRMSNSQLRMPDDVRFELRFRPPNIATSEEDVRLSIKYNGPAINRSGTELRPDILFEAFYKGKHQRFVIDAKYRRYHAMTSLFRRRRSHNDAETPFEDDLCGTARDKYLTGLNCDAAFIAHSDPDPSYTFFGGSNDFQRTLPTPHPKLADAKRPNHSFGSVYVSPTNAGLRNMKKLIECILMYHLGVDSICWECGSITQPTSVDGWAGQYFCCETHRFWIISHCRGEKHRLLKLGAESFHNFDSKNVWACECPVCGDSLDSKKAAITIRGGTFGPHTRVFSLEFMRDARQTRFGNNSRDRGTYYLDLPSDFEEWARADQHLYYETELLKLGANINYVGRKPRLSKDVEEKIKRMSEW
jgi:hypothetical protein